MSETNDRIASDVDSAVRCLQAGGLVAYPTETFYGLGVLPRFEGALSRLWDLKRRSQRGPLLLLIPPGRWPANLGLARPSGRGVLEALAKRFWPGPLTLVVDAVEGLDRRLVGPDGGVAVRISSHPVAGALLERLGEPLTSTSANFRGEPPATSPAAITAGGLEANLDFVLDGGETRGGKPSTVLRLFARHASIVRDGAVERAELVEALSELGLPLRRPAGQSS